MRKYRVISSATDYTESYNNLYIAIEALTDWIQTDCEQITQNYLIDEINTDYYIIDNYTGETVCEEYVTCKGGEISACGDIPFDYIGRDIETN